MSSKTKNTHRDQLSKRAVTVCTEARAFSPEAGFTLDASRVASVHVCRSATQDTPNEPQVLTFREILETCCGQRFPASTVSVSRPFEARAMRTRWHCGGSATGVDAVNLSVRPCAFVMGRSVTHLCCCCCSHYSGDWATLRPGVPPGGKGPRKSSFVPRTRAQ